MKLFQTSALLYHYVAVANNGDRFLVPVDPIGPEVWRRRRPYRGNFVLTEVPEVIAALYRVYHWEADHAW